MLLEDLLRKARTACSAGNRAVVFAFADDCNIVGPAPDVVEMFTKLVELLPATNLSLATQKCMAYSRTPGVAEGVRSTGVAIIDAAQGLTAVGTPIGSDD